MENIMENFTFYSPTYFVFGREQEKDLVFVPFYSPPYVFFVRAHV